VVSTFAQPEAVSKSVRAAIHQVNPRQALFDIKTMDKVIAESVSDLNLYRWLIELFAGLAMTLAIAGIYRVISYAVAARTREFGIRLALGADKSQMFRLVLRHGSMLLASGLLLGVAGAMAGRASPPKCRIEIRIVMPRALYSLASATSFTRNPAIHPPHSSRMSLDGSTASARPAGMVHAAIPSTAIVSTAPATTTGSRGFA
jgi:ABC-type antimicrobial peptide transport system permease subunit